MGTRPAPPILIFLLIGALLTACAAESIADPEPLAPAVENTADSASGPPPVVIAARAPLEGQMVFSAERNGRWDLGASSPDGRAYKSLTEDGTSRRPAISRPGTRIAFESHRDGNWEIYGMEAPSWRPVRLTNSPAFDGQPSWSPDGSRIAFASMRQGNLDIWVINADGTDLENLTDGVEAVDTEPAWSPDGRWIAFTSWRTGTAQIFTVSSDGEQTFNLSQNKFDEQSPAWSPRGNQLAFVSDRDGQRAIYIADFSTAGLKSSRRLTFSGWEDGPAWSPDGEYIAFISPRPTRRAIYVVPSRGGIPMVVGAASSSVDSVAWGNLTPPFALGQFSAQAVPALYPSVPSETPSDLIPLKDVYLAPSYGRLNDRVSASFQALRARVKAEAGWDFLGVLSDMARQLTGECGDGCQVMSWHKSGRAVDTRMAVESNGATMLEVVREDQLGETYWRLYLRAARQDGTLGEPLLEPPWDWTYTARWTLAPYQGGVTKPIPSGYYVDFTELAREYGWDRISSYDDETLSWKENINGMEFWHYQRTDGLTWYTSLRELYSSQTLAATFDWNSLLRQGETGTRMRLREVPAPAGAWRWFALFP